MLEMMQRFGHATIATTRRYLNSLASAENRLVFSALDVMGLAQEEEPTGSCLALMMKRGPQAGMNPLWDLSQGWLLFSLIRFEATAV